MNIDQIKKEFPIFDNKVQNNDLVYLDNSLLLGPRFDAFVILPECL